MKPGGPGRPVCHPQLTTAGSSSPTTPRQTRVDNRICRAAAEAKGHVCTAAQWSIGTAAHWHSNPASINTKLSLSRRFAYLCPVDYGQNDVPVSFGINSLSARLSYYGGGLAPTRHDATTPESEAQERPTILDPRSAAPRPSCSRRIAPRGHLLPQAAHAWSSLEASIVHDHPCSARPGTWPLPLVADRPYRTNSPADS